MRKSKFYPVLKIVLIVVLLSAALQWLIPALTSAEFQNFVEDLGLFGPLVIIFITVFGHIFAPIAGSPVVILSIAVFGLYQTMVYLYLASLISATTNFYISRWYGRGVVEKLVGKDSMQEVDRMVAIAGGKILAVGRVVGFPIFEIISYAAGLTRMPFRKYISITAVCAAIPNFVFSIIFRDIDFSSTVVIYLWVGGLILMGGLFTVVLRLYFKRGKKRGPDDS